MSGRRVVAVVSDLFFATRISGAARALGVALETVTPATGFAACRAAAPDLVILDLTAPGDPLGLVRTLKGDPSLATVPVVAFYPHVMEDLRRQALAAGVDRALPRSAFTARLGALLSGEERTAG